MNRLLAVLVLALMPLAGCLDNGPEGDGETTTTLTTTATIGDEGPDGPVTGLEHIGRLLVEGADTEDTADDVPYASGSGIWVHGNTVYGSALGEGFFIADISDPAHPELLYDAPDDSETAFARDADVVVHPDGAVTLVLATQNDGMHVYNVADPTAPFLMARTLVDENGESQIPNHNIATIPGTQFVFNARSGGEGSTNDLVDLRDPANPEVRGTYGTHGCHDISFHGAMGDDDFRAYCAGIQRTEIWDMTGFDPEASDFGIALVATVEGTDSPIVGNPAFATSPARTLHHLAIVNEDASILIIGDEHNGGGSPGTCFLYDETTDLSTPLGALWFYDISDETDPQLLSWFSPPTVQPGAPGNPANPFSGVPNCTAHFGTLVPGEDKLVMAWYSAGVVLVDFTDPSAPEMLDQFQPDGINTWDARVHGAYVFTGDITRGMDVLQLV